MATIRQTLRHAPRTIRRGRPFALIAVLALLLDTSAVATTYGAASESGPRLVAGDPAVAEPVRTSDQPEDAGVRTTSAPETLGPEDGR